jgi:hypothetical protein
VALQIQNAAGSGGGGGGVGGSTTSVLPGAAGGVGLRHPLLVLLLLVVVVVVVGKASSLLELAQVELVVEGITVSMEQRTRVVAVEVVMVVRVLLAVQVL